MKKTIIALLIAVACNYFTAINSYAGGCASCTPVTANCTGIFGAACPSTLPDATSGQFYSETVTFYMPASVDTTLPILGTITVPVDTVWFLGITGLPNGMYYSPNNVIFFPEPTPVSSQYGCVTVCGTPCGGNQTITFTIDLLLAVTTPFGAFQLPQSFEVTFNLNSNYPVLRITSSKDYLCPGGDVAILSAQNVFDDYDWSTGDTTPQITVTSAGIYNLTVTDSDGCEQYAWYEVLNLDATVATSSLNICANQIAQLFGSGGVTYSWSPSTGLSATNVANPVVYDLTANQTYKLVVSNGTCSDSTTVTVNVQNCNAACAYAAPNRNCTAAPGTLVGACPSTLPPITGGVSYNQNISFYFPASIPLEDIVIALIGTSIPGLPNVNVTPEVVEVSDVAGLPTGLNWSCDQREVGGGGCTYYPALFPSVTQYGSISICGSTCAPAISDTIRIIFNVVVTLPDVVPFLGGSQQDFDLELPVAYTLSYANPLTITANPSGTQPQGTPITLTASPGFTGYSWQPGGQTTASITVNTPGTYRVNANDGTCVQTASYTVTYATGIENIDIHTLNIFPNPNSGLFEIAFAAKQTTEVKVGIYNIHGSEVFSENFTAKSGNNAFNIRMHDNASGIYIVKIFAEGAVVSRRITVY
jgi:hypothetical protein